LGTQTLWASVDEVRLMAGPVSVINCAGLLPRAKYSVSLVYEATEVETHAVARANFIVNFNVYSDILDAETLDNSIFYRNQCSAIFSQR